MNLPKNDRLAKIESELTHSAFTAEFSTKKEDYLLHLTRLIDRTTDLYNFCPVVPILKAKRVERPHTLRIRAAYPKIRAITEHTSQSWEEILRLAQASSKPSAFPIKKNDSHETGDLIEGIVESSQSELVWKREIDNGFKITEPSFGYDLGRWTKNIKGIVSNTFDSKSRIENSTRSLLFLPEFSFPPISDQIQRSKFLKDIRADFYQSSEINIMNARDFMFLGSYHDSESYNNVGVTVPFGFTPLDSQVRKGYQHQGNDGIYYQRKRHASKKLTESLAPVSTLDFPVFLTDYGRVLTLICSDIYDLSLFLGLTRYNLRCLPGSEIDYIIVPAYNRSRKLVETCRQLSFLMNNVVVYGSSFPFDSNRNTLYSGDSHCFICGRDATQLESQVAGMPDFEGIVKTSKGSLRIESNGDFRHARPSELEFTDYLIDPKKVALLRLVTRKMYSKAIQEGGRRTHVLPSGCADMEHILRGSFT